MFFLVDSNPVWMAHELKEILSRKFDYGLRWRRILQEAELLDSNVSKSVNGERA